MSMPRSEHEDKIAKMLAKAESTTNPHEAEAFTRAAERLMIKWGVEEALVRAKMIGEVPPENIVEQRLEYTDTYSDAFVTFSHAIVEGLGQLRCYYTRGRRHDDQRFIYIVGFESDVGRAIMLIASLRLQAISAMKTWWRTSGLSGQMKGWHAFKTRRQFIISFGYEVGRRLADTRRETVAEIGGKSTELVLRDRSTQVDDWMASHVGKLRAGRAMSASLIGAAEGREAGRRADLGTGRLSGDRTAIDGEEASTINTPKEARDRQLKAAALIEKRGHARHRACNGPEHGPDRGGPLCVVCAYRMAVGQQPRDLQTEAVKWAMWDLARHLWFAQPGDVRDWNDAPERTTKQVVRALRACAASLKGGA